jgi:hypothetical protein
LLEIIHVLTPKLQRQRKGFNQKPKGLKRIQDDNLKVGTLILFLIRQK